MDTPATYLIKTETAVRKLFEGIKHYTDLLTPIKDAVFVGDGTDFNKLQHDYDLWASKNAAALAASTAAQKLFSAQSFAMATLCGAVLQVAAKAIECYSQNQDVPEHLTDIARKTKSAHPFCIGREIKGLPIGLIIYAGRNQHTHFNDSSLSKINTAIFDQLALHANHPSLKDPGLDLGNPSIDSHANNITSILGWRSYESYEADIRALLGIHPGIS
jgi:hypothetical protein